MMDVIQGVVPAHTPLQKSHAHLRYNLIGMVQVGHTPIYVQSKTMCWSCRKDFMAQPYTWYCSERCETTAQMQEDMARDR